MTTSKPSAARPSEEGSSSVLYQLLRGFGFLVLVLMLASIVYSGWIAIENWDEINV